MAGETIITVVGNLVADPELRYTQNGLPVANFTIASTPRHFDKQSNEWKDDDALFMRCSLWREFAEQVAGSLTKGMRVIASGRLKQRSYQDREGNNRTSIELEVDEIGPSLRYATAVVQRAQRDSSRTRQQPSAYQQEQDAAWQAPGTDEPWATPSPASTPQEQAVRNPGGQPQQQAPDAWSGANQYGDDTPF